MRKTVWSRLKNRFIFGLIFASCISSVGNSGPIYAQSPNQYQLYQQLTGANKVNFQQQQTRPRTRRQRPTTLQPAQTPQDVDTMPTPKPQEQPKKAEPIQMSRIEKMFRDIEHQPEFEIKRPESSPSLNETSENRPNQRTGSDGSRDRGLKRTTSGKQVGRQEYRDPLGRYSDTPSSNQEILRQFGYDLFENYQPSESLPYNIAVGPDYLLGSGDGITVRIWGKINETLELTVDQYGKIFIPKVGDINVSGVTFGDLPKLLKSELSRQYVNFEISVALSSIRTIKVYVVGDVARPGAYDVSSLATALDALYAAGGPTKTGSLRRIFIKRQNKTHKVLDLYRYLLSGDRSQDPKLQPNDTIFVPVIGDVVKIQGEVKRPGIFEIVDGTTVSTGLYRLAGGPAAIAYTKRLTIKRITKGAYHKVFDLQAGTQSSFAKKLKKKTLVNGDIVTIRPIVDDRQNLVSISGHISIPDIYEFSPKMTLGDLTALAGNPKDGAYLNRVEVLRYVSEDQRKIFSVDFSTPNGKAFQLHNRDQVRLYSKTEILGEETVYVGGAVQNGGAYKRLEGMRVLDLFFLGGGTSLTDFSTAELFRTHPDGQSDVYRINIEDLLADHTHPNNIVLQDQDRLSLRENGRLSSGKKITITGQVRNPGIYYAKENETLSSVIARAGGFTPKAFPSGAILRRKSVQNQEANGNRQVLEEEKKRLIYDQSRFNAISNEAQFLYQESLNFLEEKIKENEGRIIVDIENPEEDILIENEDEIVIPETPSSIQVVGGVQRTAAIIYQPDQNPKYYIEQVGGYSEYASKNQLFVIRSNGSVVKNAKVIHLGDTIYVPELIKREVNYLGILGSVTQIFFNIASSLTFLGLVGK